MGTRLREGLTFCISNDQTALFDLPADRFFGLPPELDHAFQALVRGDIETDDDTVRPLFDLRVLVAGEGETRPTSPSLPLPAAGAIPNRRRKVKALCFVQAALSQGWAWRTLRSSPLSSALDKLRKAKTVRRPTAPGHPERLTELVSSFAATRRFIPNQDQCLRLSLALAYFLNRNGIPALMVIGVRMRPYAAHAWVQVEDVLLNDQIDFVRRYTPILVI